MTLEELKEEIEPFLPFVNHLHFIPGKAPSFYPALSEDSGQATATKVQTAKGIITFSAPGKKPEQEEAEPRYVSPQELLNQKILAEEYHIKVLGGRLASAYISFTQPDQLLLFAQKFDGKVIESSRGRHYRTVVRLSSIPGAYLSESLCISESYVGSLEDSPLFIKWREEQKSKQAAEERSSSVPTSLSFEQQTELLLEQERQLHPWKYDPSFFQKTPLMSFLAKEAEKERELEEESGNRQQAAERKKQEKKKKSVKKKEAKKSAQSEPQLLSQVFGSKPEPKKNYLPPEPKRFSQQPLELQSDPPIPKFKIKPRQTEPSKKEVPASVKEEPLKKEAPDVVKGEAALPQPAKQPTQKKFSSGSSRESKWATKEPKPNSQISVQESKPLEKPAVTKPLEQLQPAMRPTAQSKLLEQSKPVSKPQEQAPTIFKTAEQAKAVVKPEQSKKSVPLAKEAAKEVKPVDQAASKKFFTTASKRPAAS